MTKRIFYSVFLMALAVMLVVTTMIVGMMYSFSSREKQNELRREAAYIAEGIKLAGSGYLEQVGELDDTRITWVAADGTVIYDSVAEADVMENHADRKEIEEAFQKGSGEGERHSVTLAEKNWYYALRLEDGSVVRLSVESEGILRVFLSASYPLVFLLALLIVLSMSLAFRTAKYITKPINEIDLEHPEQMVIYDELTPLLRRITMQKREIQHQMKELKRRKEEFDTITANMQEGFLVLDTAGEVLSYNEGAKRLLGTAAVQEGESVFRLNRSEGFRRGVETALKGEHREERLEINGKICEVVANPVFHDGEKAGVILMLFDATEKEGRERLRREFTANVSHELKTPLTSISGFAEIMKSGMVRQEDMGTFAGKIYEEAQRLIVLIQDIIKLSKLDEKDSLMEREWVLLEEIVFETKERLMPMAEKKNVRILAEAEAVRLWGVKPVLTEMIYNLCDNAIRYNVFGGSVFITLRKEEEKAIFSVTDTGIGIPQEEQERIFERFYRVDSSRSAENGSTGLGLSIVKHGAALHKGKVTLKSAVGEGSCMTITFSLQNVEKEIGFSEENG